jgi:hypothetical protein
MKVRPAARPALPSHVDALLHIDEPIDIDAVTATTQDTTEPEPLK